MTGKERRQPAKRKDYSKLVRALRDRLGLSQEKLAPRIGVSLPTINRWEKGKCAPRGVALSAIEQFVRSQGGGFRDLYEAYFPLDPEGAQIEGLAALLRPLMTGQVTASPRIAALLDAAARAAKRGHAAGGPDEGKIKEIVRRIVEAAAPEKIILFGSAVRGEMGPDSDLDFLVVKSCLNPRVTAQAIYRNMRGIDAPKDILVVTPKDLERHKDTVGLIYRSALREGKVVYAA